MGHRRRDRLADRGDAGEGPSERLTGSEGPEVIERHVARYHRAIELAGRTGGVWWDVGCGNGYGTELMQGGALVVCCPIGNGPSATNPYHLHEPTGRELRGLVAKHFRLEHYEAHDYMSTSGPAVQAYVVGRAV